MESCGSCHNNIDFIKGEGHPAQADNSNCVACHNPDWTREVHANQENMAALEQFKAEVTNASVSGTSLSFSLKLSNPQTGAAYNDSADKQVFVNDLRVYANWGTSFDYATRSARSIRVHEVVPLSGSDGIYQYQLDGLTIPAGSEADAGTLAIQAESVPAKACWSTAVTAPPVCWLSSRAISHSTWPASPRPDGARWSATKPAAVAMAINS